METLRPVKKTHSTARIAIYTWALLPADSENIFFENFLCEVVPFSHYIMPMK